MVFFYPWKPDLESTPPREDIFYTSLYASKTSKSDVYRKGSQKGSLKFEGGLEFFHVLDEVRFWNPRNLSWTPFCFSATSLNRNSRDFAYLHWGVDLLPSHHLCMFSLLTFVSFPLSRRPEHPLLLPRFLYHEKCIIN